MKMILKLKKLALIFSLLISMNAHSDGYYHVGSGVSYMQHDRSYNDYLLLDLKAGLGYELTKSISFELDVILSSDGISEGKVVCDQQNYSGQNCDFAEQIDRNILAASVLYHHHFRSYRFFVKPALGIAKSSYQIVITNDQMIDNKIVDEESKSFITLINAGYIAKDKHRISGVISRLFGKSDTGYFDYVGIEYNYLFYTRWDF